MALFGHLFFSPKVTNDDQLGTAIEASVDRLQRLRLQFFDGCVRVLSLEPLAQKSPFVRSNADFALRGFQFRLLTNHVGTNRYVSRELFEKLVDTFLSRMAVGDGATPEGTEESAEKIWPTPVSSCGAAIPTRCLRQSPPTSHFFSQGVRQVAPITPLHTP
jgi:hypothetical protein